MKKAIVAMMLMAMTAVAAGCGNNNTAAEAPATETEAPVETETEEEAPADSMSGAITVLSREDGSGTRGAFIELFGIEQKDASGQKVDLTIPSAAITNSTAVMMTSVASDPNAIGYLSLGSLDDTVRALSIDGAEPTAANVKSGVYQIARPFNIVMTEDASPAAQDLAAFIMSAEGQAIVEENGYVSVAEGDSYVPSGMEGKVVVAGSSSVTPVMEKLAEAYRAANPGMTVEVQQSDSTTGVNMALEGTCDIGMASRDLKDEEKDAGAQATVIAQDGIAVIVSQESSIDDLSTEQVMEIYTGAITNWDDLI